MHPYGVRDVERLLRLSRSTVRAFIAAGFVAPARGHHGAWLFSFQDLIVLRTAQALSDAKVPQRRITRSVRELRRHLPDAMPLSGLSICAVADHVVIREGSHQWQADSGQYLLGFDGDPADGSLSVIERTDVVGATETAPVTMMGAQEWFDRGVILEPDDVEAAVGAYARAVNADPAFRDAAINLGRLLHDLGRFDAAERVYRDAIQAGGNDPLLLYNLGVLLDDLEREAEAMDAYETALRGDPGLADCHYNLSLLYEKRARPKDAIRHMARYRVLTASRGR